jgi:hypothetical protein
MKANRHCICLVHSAIVLAVFVIHPASAVPITHDLVVTENSSTDLTATYDGSPVTVIFLPAFPDNWEVLLPFAVGSPNRFFFEWSEPDSALVNGIEAFAPGSAGTPLAVFSDFTGGAVVAVPDDTTITNALVDERDNGSISLTFDDDGDVPATVPDKGSTFTLLCLSSIALFAGTRFRRLRTA